MKRLTLLSVLIFACAPSEEPAITGDDVEAPPREECAVAAGAADRLPELAVSNLAFEAGRVKHSGPFAASIAVRNAGSPISDAAIEFVAIDAEQTYVLAVEALPTLCTGDEAAVQAEIEFPQTMPAGDYRFQARLQRDAGGREIYWANNVAEQPLVLESDFAIAFERAADSVAKIGPHVVTLYLDNGGFAARPGRLELVLAGDAGSVTLATEALPALAYGEQQTLHFTLAFTAAFEADEYRLLARVQPEAPALETSLLNNASEIPFAIDAQADLSVSIVGFNPGVALSAAPVTLTVEWHNGGFAAVDNNFVDSLKPHAAAYLVREGEQRADMPSFMAGISIPTLLPGETQQVSYTLRALRGAGTYHWQVTAQTVSSEVDLANNVAAHALPLQVVSPLNVGWIGAVDYPGLSSLAYADLNSDATLDIIVDAGIPELWGKLHAVNGLDGSPLWTFDAPTPFGSSPAVTSDRIFVGALNGTFYALDASDGALVWSAALGARTTSPAIIEENGDTKVVVTGGSHDLAPGYVAVLDGSDGQVLWQHVEPGLGYQHTSSPAVGDLDANGYADIVVAERVLDGGVVRAYAGDGTTYSERWAAGVTNSSFVASPLLADADGDAKLDVLVQSRNGTAYAYRGTDGTLLWEKTFPDTAFIASGALGTLTQGEAPAFIVAAHTIYDDRSIVMALDISTGTEKWRYVHAGNAIATPIAVDIDADGLQEIIAAIAGAIPCLCVDDMTLSGQSIVLILNSDGDPMGVFETAGLVVATPVLVDRIGAGQLDLILASYGDGGSLRSVSTPYSTPPTWDAQWPKFRGNPMNTGTFP